MKMVTGGEIAEAGLREWRASAQGAAGNVLGHHPSMSFRDGYGDLARRITEIAVEQQLHAAPASVSALELGLATGRGATIASAWVPLLTGNAEAQGAGSPRDEIRAATGHVPNPWFADADEHAPVRQRFHAEVYVAQEVAVCVAEAP